MNPFAVGSVKKAPQSRGMSRMLRRLAARRAAHLLTTGAFLALGAHSAMAQGLIAGDTAYNFTPSNGNFSTGFTPTLANPLDTTAQLIFTGGPYTATDDIANQDANSLTFNDIGLITVIPGTAGNTITLTANGSVMPTIYVGPGGATLSTIIAGSSGFTKRGSGTLTLNNVETYTGATSVNAGILTLDFGPLPAATTNILQPTSTLSLGGGTLNVLGNAAGGSSQTFAGLTLTSGASTITGGAGGNNPTINLGALTAYNAGSTVVFNGAATSTGLSSATGQTGANGNATTTGAVAATATINSTAPVTDGVLIAPGNGANSNDLYGTVGLYDYATVVNGVVTGVSQGTGGSAGDGGYILALANSNIAANQTHVLDVVGNSGSSSTHLTLVGVRFNTAQALTFSTGSSSGSTIGGVLVTPNVGANNTNIKANSAANFFEVGAVYGNFTGSLAVFQNDTQGILSFNTFFGYKNSNTAPIIQSGPGTVFYATTTTGFADAGSFYLNGGTTEINGDNSLGQNTGGAPVFINGGALVNAATFNLDTNNAGANARNIVIGDNGGTLAALNTLQQTIDGVISGTGPLNIGLGTIVGTGTNGGTLNGVALTTTSNTGPGTGLGSNNFGTQVGGGTVLLNNNTETYTGATNINFGTLLLAPTSTTALSLASTQPVTIASGATLGMKDSVANGTVNIPGAVTNNGGTISTVDGKVGRLNLTGGLTLNNASTVNFEIGSTSDLISLGSGILNFSGTTTINLTAIAGLAASATPINLFTFGSETGYVAGTSFILGTTPSGFNYTLTNNATSETVTVSGNPVPATAYWTGSQGTSTWNTFTGTFPNTLTNFSKDAADANDTMPTATTGNTLQLPGSITDVIFTANTANVATLNTTLGQDFSIKGLEFNATDQTATTVGGANTLTIGADGLQVDSGSGASPTISTTGVVIGTSESWANNTANPLTVTSGVTGTAGGGNTTTLTFNGAGPGNTILSGVIGNGSGGGTLALTVNKTGGTLILGGTGASNFSGGLNLLAGPASPTATVQAATGASASAFGTGVITLSDNTLLDINGVSITTALLGSATGATGAGESITSTSATALTPTITLNGTGTATFAGAITNGSATSIGLTMTGSGSQTLTGVNTYTGQTTVTNGTLTIGTGGSTTSALNIAAEVGAANVNVNGGTVGSLATPVGQTVLTSNIGHQPFVNFAGTLTVQNSGRFYTTGFSVGDGANAPVAGNVFTLGTAGSTTDASQFVDTGAFNLLNTTNGGGTNTFNLNSGTLTVGSFTRSSGAASTDTIHLNGVTLSPTATDANAATFLPVLTATTVNVDGGGATINPNGNGVTIAAPLLHGTITTGGTTDGGVTVKDTASTPGSLTLTGASTYTGATTIASGSTLQLGNGTTDGTIAATSGVTDNGALIFNRVAAVSSAYPITGSGTVTMTSTGGAGQQTLTGASSYSGGTTVTSGTLVAGADGALGAGNVTVTNTGASAGTGSGGVLTLTGGTTNQYISTTGSLFLSSDQAANPFVNLTYTGTDNIAALSVNGGTSFLAVGTYGGTGSGATNIDTDFTGSGILNVTAPAPVPEPSQFVAFGLGIMGLGGLTLRARRRSAKSAQTA